MWRSFFFAVGIVSVLIGLQSLAVEEFRVDTNNRLFAFANRANRAIEATSSQKRIWSREWASQLSQPATILVTVLRNHITGGRRDSKLRLSVGVRRSPAIAVEQLNFKRD